MTFGWLFKRLRRGHPCIVCVGTGNVVIDVDRDGLVYVDICWACGGTGWQRN